MSDRRSRLLLSLVTVILAACAAPQPDATRAVDRCSLDIMLTNDDGWDAPGITAMREALLGAGHRVTLVGPREQQSGRGGAINTSFGAVVDVVEQAPGVWSVDGTPTDAVRAGLDVILAHARPDLVVSGSNFGPNLGQEGVHNSGTLGAALAAFYDGLPAIAVSTGIDVAERDTTPPFRSTFAGFTTAAAITVSLIDTMAGRFGCDDVLPKDVALNVNVPVPVESIKGIRYAPLSKRNAFRLEWTRSEEDGKVRIGYRRTEPSLSSAGDDVSLYNSGYVTITPINGDVTIESPPARLGLPERLNDLLPTGEAAP